MKKWLQFINERFSPTSHILMIGVFSGAHALFLRKIGGATQVVIWQFWTLLAVFYLLFFFLLRCYDEIKDYEYDMIHNKLRPLPRGLLRVKDLKIAIVLIVFLLVGFLYFFNALPFGFLVLIYSFLMYKEFFVGKYIRPHLTFYAITHTFVIGFCSFSITWAFVEAVDSHSLRPIIVYSLTNWFLFNVFEFARKTFAISEEKSNVESYSKVFGTFGAVCLSVSQFCMANLALYVLKIDLFTHWILVLLSVFTGAFLVFKNTPRVAKFYRNTFSVILILYYVFICVEFFK